MCARYSSIQNSEYVQGVLYVLQNSEHFLSKARALRCILYLYDNFYVRLFGFDTSSSTHLVQKIHRFIFGLFVCFYLVRSCVRSFDLFVYTIKWKYKKSQWNYSYCRRSILRMILKRWVLQFVLVCECDCGGMCVCVCIGWLAEFFFSAVPNPCIFEWKNRSWWGDFLRHRHHHYYYIMFGYIECSVWFGVKRQLSRHFCFALLYAKVRVNEWVNVRARMRELKT